MKNEFEFKTLQLIASEAIDKLTEKDCKKIIKELQKEYQL